MDCLFCSIINGEIPSSKVYEDELVYAFNDIDLHVLYGAPPPDGPACLYRQIISG